MQSEVIIAGFGGQGVLLVGHLIAYAGMLEDKEVTWLPSYGPEIRGGTCNCTVVVSDRRIGSPSIPHPTAVIAMNRPSLDKFEPAVAPGGTLIVNSSLTDRQPVREDLRIFWVPASGMAQELGSSRVANLILLGVYIASTGVVSFSGVMASLEEILPADRHHLLPLNRQALEAGMAFVNGVAPSTP